MEGVEFEEVFRHEEASGFSHLIRKDLYAAIYPDGPPRDEESSVDMDNGSDAKEYMLPNVPLELAGTDGERSSVVDPNSDARTCQVACERNEKCLQFLFRNNTIAKNIGTELETRHQCFLSSAFRLGLAQPRQGFGDNVDEPDTFRSWTSGWRRETIMRWVRERPDCPGGYRWDSTIACS